LRRRRGVGPQVDPVQAAIQVLALRLRPRHPAFQGLSPLAGPPGSAPRPGRGPRPFEPFGEFGGPGMGGPPAPAPVIVPGIGDGPGSGSQGAGTGFNPAPPGPVTPRRPEQQPRPPFGSRGRI
jgi:hypothetical protein